MKLLKFENVYVNNYYTFLASDEKEPIIKKKVDKVADDYYMGGKSPEVGESIYQNICVNGLLKKCNLKAESIDLMVGGDLQNQILASNFNASNYHIPFLGVYSACASFMESMIISSTFIESKMVENAICVTSSNNLVTEKQFRFPIEYGALRKKVNSFTASGSVCALLSSKKSNIKVESATIGRIITLGHTDANDMGACMAPGVAETLYDHFTLTKRKPEYYDIILTGDLGIYGTSILKEYMKQKYKIELNNVKDAGALLYNVTTSSDFAGASGPICAPIMLFADIIHKYKKVLVVASGALHSCVSTNLKLEMPGVGHAISLEVL